MSSSPRILTVIGAPFAAWAMYSCLALVAIDGGVAVGAGVAWGLAWTALAYAGSRRGGVGHAMRGGAIITSLFLPLPVYLLAVVADWLKVFPASVGVPMFATLCVSGPLYLWSLALRGRRRRRTSGPVLVVPWHNYEPRSSAAIPPRASTMHRAM